MMLDLVTTALLVTVVVLDIIFISFVVGLFWELISLGLSQRRAPQDVHIDPEFIQLTPIWDLITIFGRPISTRGIFARHGVNRVVSVCGSNNGRVDKALHSLWARPSGPGRTRLAWPSSICSCSSI